MTKSVKTPKELLFILGGNSWQSCCDSNIKCLSCSRRTKSTRFVTLLSTNYSILGLCVLKYTKKITKITQDEKKHRNTRSTTFILGGKGWQSCCATYIKFLSCSRKTKSTKFVKLSHINYSILGHNLLKYTKKSQNYPQSQNSVKTPKAPLFTLGGNSWQSRCARNMTCSCHSTRTKFNPYD